MEAAIVYWVTYWGLIIGIMENKMEATIVHFGVERDNGKESGNCYM